MNEEQGKQLIPRTKGTKDCGDPTPITGNPSMAYDYVRKPHNEDTKKITDDLNIVDCDPWYYYNMKVGNLQAEGTITAPNFQGTINVQSWKGFDIKHPNKENHRLRHICLEGPEAGVYIRGRLTNSNVIDIPKYWNGLIDLESITVTLTQIGYSQDLIIEKIYNNQIHIKSGNQSSIDCYYSIYASRIDGEPLIVEYEGQTPGDYPGSSKQFSISGYDYGSKES